MSPRSCFHGVYRLRIFFFFHCVCRLQAVFTACFAFQLAIFGVCRFHSNFMVSFKFCSPFSVHSACRLQLVFMACVALRLAAFLALDVFRLVFITCFALIFFVFSTPVSLLGFLSLYSASIPFRLVCLWYFLLLI